MAPEYQLLRYIRLMVLTAPIILMVTFVVVFEAGWKVKKQPFPFNHKLHAGDRQIDCKYCHRGVEKGNSAGVPSISDCWSCHQNLTGPGGHEEGGKKVNVIDRPDVQTLLRDYVEQKQEIKWYKVYDMPEHVKFPHRAHINAGLECVECHGKVENQTVVQMKQKPHMGWCIECHRSKNAPVDCSVCHY
jgi:hypothetical protein